MSVARELFFDLPVPKKLVVILWIFLINIILLLGLSYLTIENLSAARAYVGGEGLWSKAQKQAVRELLLYSTSRSETHFDAYQRALMVPLGDRQARLELEKPHSDMNLVRSGLLQGRNNPEDVNGMAALFRRCRKMSRMSEAIEIWSQGDALIDQLQGQGSELHREISLDKPDAVRIAQLAGQINAIADQLTPLEDNFSYTLGAGARQAKHVFLSVTSVATAASFAGGLLFTLFMLRHMRETERRHRHLLDAANDLILVIDAESGVVVEANARSGNVLGRMSGEMIGKEAETIVSESDREIYRDMVRATLEGRSVAGKELHLRRGDGTALAFEVNAVMTEFAGRQLIQGIFRDIRERKRLEEETSQAQKMEVVGRLVGGIAHDFNNLLMVILTQLSKVGASPNHERRLEHVHTARIAAEAAASLTRQLLSFGRRQVLVLQVLDLNGLLEEVNEMLSALPTEQVRMTMKLSVESLPVKVDPGKIEQVIMNLAVNACDAMPSGGDLIIRTGRAPRPAPETEGSGNAVPFAMLEVTDTGYGMDAKTKAHLFEPFFTTKPFGKGTGLGLSTAYGIVKQSGGSIEVESSPLGGSTFRVYLPIVEQAVGRRKVHERRASSLKGSETVLLAEDQPAIRNTLCEFLEAEGYKVLEAQNGNEAHEIAKSYVGRIDVLVANVIMPHIRGTELAKLLTELRPEMCVVLISGYSEDALLENQMLAAGRTLLLQKPFDPEELVRGIRESLNRSHTPPETGSI